MLTVLLGPFAWMATSAVSFWNDVTTSFPPFDDPVSNYSLWVPSSSYEHLDRPTFLVVTSWMQTNWHHTLTASLIYYTSIIILSTVMKDRPAFNLKWPLVAWNATLAIFSIRGSLAVIEELVQSLATHGIYITVCAIPDPDPVSGFWILAFIVSKLFEFGDTVFVVLRKKPLIFLHYYHHAVVLIYTVHGSAERASAGRMFIAMNYAAHSFMYTYYSVSATGHRFPRWVAKFVTTIQTAQMFAGLLINAGVYYVKTHLGWKCRQSMADLHLSFFIYATFAALFCQFYYRAYLAPKPKPAKLRE